MIGGPERRCPERKGQAVALAPGNSESFMREVDDAVREDALRSAFARFGKPLIALIIVGLIGLAGWLFWQDRQQGEAGETGRRFVAALDSFEQSRVRAASRAAQPFTTDSGPGYRAAALMLQGDAALAQDNVREAAAKFGAVANDADVPQALRDIALLRQTVAEYDALQPDAVVTRLRNLVASDGPMFASAAELTALAELKRGNDRAAGLLFQRIARAENVPDSLKSRAVQMAGMLGVDAVEERTQPARAAAGE